VDPDSVGPNSRTGIQIDDGFEFDDGFECDDGFEFDDGSEFDDGFGFNYESAKFDYGPTSITGPKPFWECFFLCPVRVWK
jgi:hypothetical protein